MMSGPLEIVTILATGMVKFFFSPSFSYGFGYGFIETFVLTSLGGCLGVLFFYRISGWLMKRARLKRFRRATSPRKGTVVTRSRVFTRRNRWIVRVKHRSGLKGLAALTPLILTIPLGSILAARYFRHDRRTLPALLSSVVIQAMVITAFWNVVFNTADSLVR